MELEETPFSLRSLVKETSEIMRAQATRKGLALNVRVADDVPEVIRSDALKLKQILVNLISNSVKFTRVGSVALTVTVASDADATEVEMRQRMSEEAAAKIIEGSGANVVPAGDKYAGKPMKQSSKELRRMLKSGEGNRFERAKGKEYLRFEVEDTGVGMTRDVLTRIFEPFEQANRSTNRTFGGTGLGLALSKSLVELYGGILRASSNAGRGSVFSFAVGVWTTDRDGGALSDRIDTILGEGIEVVPDPPENEALIYNSYYDMTLGGVPGVGGPGDASNDDDDPTSAARWEGARPPYSYGGRVPERVPGGSSRAPPTRPPSRLRTTKTRSDEARLGEEGGTPRSLVELVARDAAAAAAPSPAAILSHPAPRRVSSAATLTTTSDGTNGGGNGANVDGRETGGGLKNRDDLRGAGPISVLIAEDNALNRKILSSQLKCLGDFNVRHVVNGAEAVDVISSSEHDEYAFVIMDYQMPVMDGIEATRRIRQLEQDTGKPPVAIVGYTASVEQSVLRRAEEVGMDMVLSKPCSIPKLRALIKMILMAHDLAAHNPSGETLGSDGLWNARTTEGGSGDGGWGVSGGAVAGGSVGVGADPTSAPIPISRPSSRFGTPRRSGNAATFREDAIERTPGGGGGGERPPSRPPSRLGVPKAGGGNGGIGGNGGNGGNATPSKRKPEAAAGWDGGTVSGLPNKKSSPRATRGRGRGKK